MNIEGWAEILSAIVLSVALAWPIGAHIGRVWSGEPTFLDPLIGPIERLLYRAAAINPERGQDWVSYALSLLTFHAVGFFILYAICRLQHWAPFNPQAIAGMSPDLAFNVAMGFVTNTDWQSYAPEHAASPFLQMAGLTTQNFASGASGMAIAAALSRGFAAKRGKTIGNFWADMVRSSLYVLLPLSVVVAVALMALGVPQTLASHIDAHTIEGAKQTLVLGPVASQEAIKQVGTNGGGFYNANSAHPYENPSPISNMLEMVAMNVVGFACAVAFGRVAHARSDARSLIIVMAILVTAAAGAIYTAETQPVPALTAAHARASPNMEGKEVRFGAPASAAFAAMTTGASAGSVNSMHESLMPASGGVALFLILVDETLPGGVGAGIYSMLVMALVAVFLAGLLVGRTPEYLGKKIGVREIQLAVLSSIIVAASVLGFASIAAVAPAALASLSTTGPHGLTELLYAFASTSANNGSSFDGLNANTPYLNTMLGLAMAIGRFGAAIPVLAIAGCLAAKPKLAATTGTFPTNGPVFIGLIMAVILIVAALEYFPALALGPVDEHFQMLQRETAASDVTGLSSRTNPDLRRPQLYQLKAHLTK